MSNSNRASPAGSSLRPKPYTTHQRQPSPLSQSHVPSPPSAGANGTPSSSGSNNTTSGHRKRVSTASIPLSYAYGAASIPRTGLSASPGYTAPKSSLSLNARESNSPAPQENGHSDEDMDDARSNASSRAAVQGSPVVEPASRYAKYQQEGQGSQPRSIARSHRPSDMNTSVNIATAFRQAAASTSTHTLRAGRARTDDRTEEDTLDGEEDQSNDMEMEDSLIDEEDQMDEDGVDPLEPHLDSVDEDEQNQEPAPGRGTKRKIKSPDRGHIQNTQEQGDQPSDENLSDTENARKATKKPRKSLRRDESPASSRQGKTSDRRQSTQRDNTYKATKDDRESVSSDAEVGAAISPQRERRTPRNSLAANISIDTPQPPGAFEARPSVPQAFLPRPSALSQRQDTGPSTSSSPNYATYTMREREHSPFLPRGDSSTFSQEEEIVSMLEQDRELAQRNREHAKAQFKQFGIPVPPAPITGYDPPKTDGRPILDDGGPVDEDWGVKVGRAVRESWLRVIRMLCRPATATRDLVGKGLHAALQLPWSTAGKLALVALVIAVLIGSMLEDPASKWRRPVKQQTPTYAAPNMPADDFDAVVERLSAVERVTSDLSSSLQEWHARMASEGQMSQIMVNRVDELDQRLATKLGQVDEQEQKHLRDLLQTKSDLTTELRSLQKRFSTLSDEQASASRRHSQGSEALQSLAKEVEQNMKQTDAALAALNKDLKQAITAQQASDIVTDAIEQMLPARVAVRLDPKGNFAVDPKFWSQLKTTFAPAGAVQSSSSTNGKAAVTWDAFLLENQHSLKAFIDGDLEERIQSGAILSKRAFADLLRKDIKLLKVDFEKRANDNMQQIGEELLSKVAKQDRMRTDDNNKPVNVKLPSGQDVNELIQHYVDAALLRYSKDVLAKPDYALFSAGGRVIPALSSASYEARPSGLFKNIIASATGRGVIRGRPPVTALHPDISVGSCWAFNGPTASLGVRLSRTIVPTDITIEHASSDVAYDVSSAPADFEVWGIVDSEGDLLKLQQYRQSQAAADNDRLSSLPPSPRHVLLVAGAYDPHAYSHIQSFSVLPALLDLNIPVAVVQLRILGTQANGNGCLYRFRVGGAVHQE